MLALPALAAVWVWTFRGLAGPVWGPVPGRRPGRVFALSLLGLALRLAYW